MTQCYQASAPGSLMLMGEHAVLWGSACLVAAVDQRLTVFLKSRSDNNIIITSDLYGQETIALSSLNHFDHLKIPNCKHRFVMATIMFYRVHISGGFNLTITSNIHHERGFGSSAAIVAATQAVIQQFCQHAISSISLIETIQQARTIIQTVQGRGSGADVAASLCGGIIAYQMQPCKIEMIKYDFALTVLFTGYKTPTPQVIDCVQQHLDQQPGLQEFLCIQAQQCVDQARIALVNNDITSLATAFENYAVLMIEMGVQDTACWQALQFLRQQPGIQGAKISGAGLGDCVIGCGTAHNVIQLPISLLAQQMAIIDVRLSNQGVNYEFC